MKISIIFYLYYKTYIVDALYTTFRIERNMNGKKIHHYSSIEYILILLICISTYRLNLRPIFSLPSHLQVTEERE